MGEGLSQVIRAAHVKAAPLRFAVVADTAQCAELAAAFGLPGIASLRGDFVLTHERGGVIAAELTLQARVTQVCVITLEPFEQVVAEHATLRFVPAGKLPESEDFGALDAETLEGPDEIPYAGEVIDLGAVLAEQLALSLDPYPRKPGAALPEEVSGAGDNPFAVLARKTGAA